MIGIHHDIAPEQYYADPCDEISLTSSGIKRLLTGSPAEFAAHNPRLTAWPELLDGTTDAKDLGTIVHTLVLGKGMRLLAADPEDAPARTDDGKPYQTWSGRAKVWKKQQEDDGAIILSKKNGTAAKAQSAAESMIRLLQKEYGDWPIGDSEVVLVWQRETEYGPIWCRAMLDHLSLQHMLILDPKSTSLGISDRSVQKIAANDMWHIQQAWYLEAVEALRYPGPFDFRFPVVEMGPPYQSRLVELSPEWIGIARQRIDRAANIFARCMKEQRWPAQPVACSPRPPVWLVNEFENEELAVMEGRLDAE